MSGKIYTSFTWVICIVFLAIVGGLDAGGIPSLAGEIDGPEPSGAPAGRLPVTGHTRCYDNARGIPCPHPGEPFYGQDANFIGEPMSFTDNGDGTVTDQRTGLTWQKQDDGVTRNWTTSVTYCEDLSLAGHDDWRLPTKKELISIMDYGRANPAIDPAYFPDTKQGWYWTSTLRAVDSYYAWSVFSANGRIHGNHKSGGAPFASPGRIFGGLKSGDFYARCVRGGMS